MKAIVVSCCVLAVVGCRVKSSPSGETGVKIVARQQGRAIAAGASLDIAVVDACAEAEIDLSGTGPGKIPSTVTIDFERQTCELSDFDEFRSVMTSDPEILEVSAAELGANHGAVTLRAVEAGSTTLQVEVATSTGVHDARKSFDVAVPDDVELHARCLDDDRAFQGPQWVAARSTVRMEMELFASEEPLTGYGYYPFQGFGDADVALDEEGLVTFEAPGEAGLYTITSPLDPELSFDLHVVSPESVDSVGFDYDFERCGTVLRVAPVLDADLCAGEVGVRLEIATPGTCSFLAPDSPHEHVVEDTDYSPDSPGVGVMVRSDGTGSCRLVASVVGGSHRETLELPFDDCVDWRRASTESVDAMTASTDGPLVFEFARTAAVLSDGNLIPIAEGFRAYGAVAARSADLFWYATFVELFRVVSGDAESIQQVNNVNGSASVAGEDIVFVGPDAARLSGGELVEIPIEGGEDLGLDVVSASSASSAFAVGRSALRENLDDARLFEFDGDAFREVHVEPSTSLNAIYSASSTHAVAVGDDCVVVAFDGAQWRRNQLPCNDDLLAVHGQGTDLVVAAGGNGALVVWDGSTWSTQWIRDAGLIRAVVVTPDGSIAVGGSAGVFESP